MSLIENLILLKKTIAEKSKIRYHIRKLEGRTNNLYQLMNRKREAGH